MFHCEAGKDGVVIARGGRSNHLPCKSKRACRNLPSLLSHLDSLWRIRDSRDPNDVRHPPHIWNNLFEELHLLGEQDEPRNSGDVPSGRAKLVMRPDRKGSDTPGMTIGIVAVSRFSALTKRRDGAISTSGRRDTSSRASAGT